MISLPHQCALVGVFLFQPCSAANYGDGTKTTVFGHPAYVEKTALRTNAINFICVFNRIASLVGSVGTIHKL
jgi:hypothetical protein